MSFDLRSLLHWMPDPYLILDSHFIIVDASDAYLNATMVSRDDVVGKSIFVAFPEDANDDNATTIKNLRYSLEQVVATKKPHSMSVQKYDIVRPADQGGGLEERYWSPMNIPLLDDKNEVEFIIHRAIDVTNFIRMKKNHDESFLQDDKAVNTEAEIFRQAQLIQDMNKKLAENRLMIENIKDYAIIMLDKTGRIMSWNAGAERIKGYKAEEILGKHFSIFYSQEDQDRKHPEHELQLATQNGRYEEEGWRIRKDGSRFWANVLITPFYDQNNELIGFGKVTRDLTDKKKIEQLKNEFVSVVSHELRTPLTSIRGSISLLLGGAGGALSDKAKNLLTIADTNSDRLSRLINDILDFEKIEAGKMVFKFQDYDLSKLILESSALNQMYAEKFGVTIAIDHLIAHTYVKVDTDRLMQVLTNLISNAVKFSPRDGQVKLSMALKDGYVRVMVADHGPGIPEEFKEKIFQRFSQADSSTARREGGTGLGLAISRAIIERLGGSLSFESEIGKGAVFYFDLPVIANVSRNNAQVAQNGERILICEDDREQALYLSTLLEGAGYTVDLCSSAAQVRSFLGENHYYALLLDLILPDMNGIDLIKILRGSPYGQKVPIIVISIIAKESRELFPGNSFEVVDWLEKPIDFNKLSAAFEAIKKFHLPAHPMKILHVEDDLDMQQMVKNLLDDSADITFTETIAASKEILAKNKFDLLILDLLLPDGNGAELLPLISEHQIPVIVFSNLDLEPKYAQYVNQVLAKAKTSPADLLDKVQALIAKKNEGAKA